MVEPGPLSEGFARYDTSEMEHYVFEFLLNYVRRVKSDMEWKKLLKRNPEKPFLMFVTPSDIAFILSLIKNGMKMWDQAKGQEDNPTERESKAQPLFTKGEGQKRESGMSVWSNEGLNFYYTAEKNWKNVYNDNDELSNMCNKWERWEPEDKVKRIQSGHTGGEMTNRKMMLRMWRNRMNHGGNLREIWGSVMRVRGSQKLVGMRTLKKADKRYDRGGICILHLVKKNT